MGEIEKRHNLESRLNFFFSGIEKYQILFAQNFSVQEGKKLRLTNQYDTRHFTKDLFFEMFHFDSVKAKKVLFKHNLTQKNLITAWFNTKKSNLSIVYNQEIYEIL
jgi:hypothetical protein